MGLLIIQFCLLALCTWLGVTLLNNSLENLLISLIIVFISWGTATWLTQKHKLKTYQHKIKYVFAPYPKAYLVQVLIVLALFQLFNISSYLMKSIIVATIIYCLVETLIIITWLSINKQQRLRSSSLYNIKKYDQHDLDLDKGYRPIRIILSDFENLSEPVLPAEIISNYYEICLNKVDDNYKDGFIFGNSEHIKQSNASNTSLVVLNTRINDIANINDTLKTCYSKLLPGGYLIVNYNSIKDTTLMLRNKYKSLLFYFIFPVHWIIYRVLSKIQKVDVFQRWITGGKNKVLSWVEVWGRLAYMGFEVNRESNIDGTKYIIARKVKTISENPNPSYYIFIRLNRVSLYGNIIKICKIRSMYPYSEFLQKQIFEQNQLGNSGKFKNDPRITLQGKFFRKFWIDEIPQLIDWFRGEIKLVGIRAMSQHYFSLYSQRYKDLYLQVKPGIISPIFDEETSTFNDIEKIEYEYLSRYLSCPTKTDWKYFWLTFNHILKGVRSK